MSHFRSVVPTLRSYLPCLLRFNRHSIMLHPPLSNVHGRRRTAAASAPGPVRQQRWVSPLCVRRAPRISWVRQLDVWGPRELLPSRCRLSARTARRQGRPARILQGPAASRARHCGGHRHSPRRAVEGGPPAHSSSLPHIVQQSGRETKHARPCVPCFGATCANGKTLRTSPPRPVRRRFAANAAGFRPRPSDRPLLPRGQAKPACDAPPGCLRGRHLARRPCCADKPCT